MRIIILQDDLYKYLVHVVQAHAHGGIEPEEGQALYFLNLAVSGAQQVDEKQVAKLAIPESGPAGLSVEPTAGGAPPSEKGAQDGQEEI